MSEQKIQLDAPFVVAPAPKSVEMTVYQGGAAVVREKRNASLPGGKSRLAFEGLPTQFVEGSLTVVSVEGKGNFKLGPISYKPANLSVQAILAKMVGKYVTFEEVTPNGGSKYHSGILKHVLGNQVVLENHSANYIAPLTSRFQFSEPMPKGLSAKASLQMEPTVEQPGDFGINILYETDGITWASRYEAFYDAKAEKLTRMTCWIDLTNASGAALTDAKFKLIAQSNYGNRRAKGRAFGAGPPGAPMMAAASLESTMSADSADVESVGEAKMYVLPDTLSLDDGESKQTVLTMTQDVPAKPEYFAGAGYYNEHGARKHDDAQKEPVYVRLRLSNDAASNLGLALPPGAVTIFEADSSGSLQKTDTAHIGHVAQDEKFALQLRNPSKDIKITRVLVDSDQDPEPEVRKPVRPVSEGPRLTAMSMADVEPQEEKPAPRYREEEREFIVHNYKDKGVEVEVQEQIPHNAEFLSDRNEHFSAEAKKTGKVTVHVAGKGKTTVSYKIKFRIN